FGSGEGLVRIAQAAETAGLSAITITDHPLVPLAWEPTLGHHDLDPFVTLAYLAAATKKLRLVTYLVVLPYRNPIPTAKALATLADGWAPMRNPPSLAPSVHTAILQTREDLVARLAYAREVAEKVGRTRPLTLVAPGMFVKLGGTRGSGDGESVATSRDEVLE